MASRNRIRRRRFTTIATAALRDTRVSMDARGLLALLCSYDETWIFRVSHLRKVTGFGRDKYFRVVNELKEFGYLRIEQIRDELGLFVGYDWYVEDQNSTSEVLKTRTTDKPESRKPVPLSKNKFIDNSEVIDSGDVAGPERVENDDEGGSDAF